MILPEVGVPRKGLCPAQSACPVSESELPSGTASHPVPLLQASLSPQGAAVSCFSPPPPRPPPTAAGPKAAEQRRGKGHGHFCHSGQPSPGWTAVRWLLHYWFSSASKWASEAKLPSRLGSTASHLSWKTHHFKHHQNTPTEMCDTGDGFRAGNQVASGNALESPKQMRQILPYACSFWADYKNERTLPSSWWRRHSIFLPSLCRQRKWSACVSCGR